MTLRVPGHTKADPPRAATPGRALRRSSAIALALATGLACTSCASITSGGSSELNVDSNVHGAHVRVLDRDNVAVCEAVTPCAIELNHADGFFRGAEYTVEVSTAGTRARAVTVTTSLNPWYLGNALLPGGLIGSLLVDPWTGAMFQLDTNEVFVQLDESRGGIRTSIISAGSAVTVR